MKIGDKFVKNTGYSRWADTNSIIVLFPQTKVDSTSRPTSHVRYSRVPGVWGTPTMLDLAGKCMRSISRPGSSASPLAPPS